MARGYFKHRREHAINARKRWLVRLHDTNQDVEFRSKKRAMAFAHEVFSDSGARRRVSIYHRD